MLLESRWFSGCSATVTEECMNFNCLYICFGFVRYPSPKAVGSSLLIIIVLYVLVHFPLFISPAALQACFQFPYLNNHPQPCRSHLTIVPQDYIVTQSRDKQENLFLSFFGRNYTSLVHQELFISVHVKLLLLEAGNYY